MSMMNQPYSRQTSSNFVTIQPAVSIRSGAPSRTLRKYYHIPSTPTQLDRPFRPEPPHPRLPATSSNPLYTHGFSSHGPALAAQFGEPGLPLGDQELARAWPCDFQASLLPFWMDGLARGPFKIRKVLLSTSRKCIPSVSNTSVRNVTAGSQTIPMYLSDGTLAPPMTKDAARCLADPRYRTTFLSIAFAGLSKLSIPCLIVLPG
ncbi:hypothetical protein T439DRAFT_331372 [Meredithblackwellia eburnea MCA 4105]